VRVGYDTGVNIEVDDDGVGVGDAPLEPGNGISGMRERAAALGGTFRAGPRPGGGFGVVARLPVDPS
jgi:signal transduction histidine kinase